MRGKEKAALIGFPTGGFRESHQVMVWKPLYAVRRGVVRRRRAGS
ncbi:hypothetical protein SAMN05216188_101891 [Lentzea xinjiangensis]|uniref:Uncharacterized protein n=1 Tax=Lentzea xinjiangensis TaxID=402600 RepID=A0A1H9BQV9_9PSEU|nr:hypothetical protein SAMN05216188_101891 [Lentzea xinjiangensis]